MENDASVQVVMRFADDAILQELVALLPPCRVDIREGAGGTPMPFVQYIAAEMIKDALIAGHEIDRTNSDGPLAEWDGWLVIRRSGNPLFLQIAQPGGKPLAQAGTVNRRFIGIDHDVPDFYSKG